MPQTAAEMIKDIDFKSIFDTAGVAMALIDKGGNILIANHQFNGSFISKTGIRNVSEIPEAGYRESFLKVIDIAYEGHAGVPYPFTFWTSVSGSRRKYEVSLSRQPGTDYFVLTASEISKMAEAYDELKRRNRDLASIVKINQIISSSFNLRDINRATMVESCKVFDFPAGFILMPQVDGRLKVLSYYSVKDLDDALIWKIEEALNAGRIAQWTREKFKTILIDERAIGEITSEEKDLLQILDVASLVSVPIVIKGKIIGFIIFGRKESGNLYFDQVTMLETLAHQIGISIQNAMLFESSEQIKERMIRQNAGLDLLYRIGRYSLEVRDIDDLFLKISREIFSTTGFDGLLIMFKSDDGFDIRHYQGEERRHRQDSSTDDYNYRLMIEILGGDNLRFIRDIYLETGVNSEIRRYLGCSGVRSIFVARSIREDSNSGIFCFFSTDRILEPTEEAMSLWTSIYVLLESIYKNFEYRKALEERERDLSIYSQQLMNAHEEERKRIAREIHDSLGQLAYALNLNVSILTEEKILAGNPIMIKIREIIQHIQEDVRKISYNLMPPMLEEMGLVASLRWLVDNMKSEDLKIGLGVNLASPINLPYPVQVQIFRIAQEAVTNILKHSKAKEANIFLYENENRFFMEIVDNGIGFSQNENTIHGMGLVGIRERAMTIGGRLKIESSKDTGTIILLELKI